MHLVRPCTLEDVSSIESLVRDNHARITSLPRKRARLSERIEHSVRSFQQGPTEASNQFFLFVLEDTLSGQLLGCAGIAMNNDRKRPFYNYRRGELIHASEAYDVHTPISVLHLTHELTGNTVLCSFAIQPKLIRSPDFELISRARFMFMRQFNTLFGERLVVELQGVCNDEGESAFWDGWGRHFFNMDYASANYHVATKNRTFLAELMPPYPVYTTLLSEAAQVVVGKHDERAEDVYQLLVKEGFEDSPYVDIFDAGRVMLSRRDSLRTYRKAVRKTVLEGNAQTGTHYLLCNDQFEHFRCGLVQLTDGLGDVIRINANDMSDLMLESESDYYFSAL